MLFGTITEIFKNNIVILEVFKTENLKINFLKNLDNLSKNAYIS